jgi:type I restriction enzyme S subunit
MYKLSENINHNKVFLINRSELDGRIDPHQYHFERRNSIKKLSQNNELLKLKDVIRNVKRNTFEIKNSDTYVGLENIVSNTGEYVPFNEKQSVSSAAVFKKGHILFPKLRPYLNKVYLAEFDGICSTEFHVFEATKVLNEFLTIYLRSDLIVNQTKHLMTGNTLPRLQTEDINNLPVPNLSIDTQQEVVNIYNAAYERKKDKEAKAKNLLLSIDKYLLTELGLTLSDYGRDLNNRVFTASLSEVTRGRFDPISIRNYKNIFLQKPKYPFLKFKELFKDNPQYGANEQAIDGDKKTDARYIRITDIDEWGNLRNDTWKTAANVNSSYLLYENNILIARTGATVGKAFIYKEHNSKAIFAGYMIRFFINVDKASPDFIFYYLNSSFYKYWISTIQRPSAQPNINSEEYKSLPIPLSTLMKNLII